MLIAKWKHNMGVKRLKSLPLHSTQTVRAAPREERAAAEVTRDNDEETEHDGNADEKSSESSL